MKVVPNQVTRASAAATSVADWQQPQGRTPVEHSVGVIITWYSTPLQQLARDYARSGNKNIVV
jgi:hypothetical protein